MLGWILPCIGHMGICDSNGVVYDFQGPYTIIADRMMLGRAARYIPLDPQKVRAGDPVGGPHSAREDYDYCVRQGNADYEKRVHCLIYPNCNHHVAHCLTVMRARPPPHPTSLRSGTADSAAADAAKLRADLTPVRMPTAKRRVQRLVTLGHAVAVGVGALLRALRRPPRRAGDVCAFRHHCGHRVLACAAVTARGCVYTENVRGGEEEGRETRGWHTQPTAALL